MISVGRKNFRPYSAIDKKESQVVFYPALFDTAVADRIVRENKKDANTLLCLTVGLAQLTGKVYKSKKTRGSLVCMPTVAEKITFQKKRSHTSTKNSLIEVQAEKGSLLIIGEDFARKWNFSLPKNSIVLYEENFLPFIYLAIGRRLKYAKKIREKMDNIYKQTQCLQKFLNLSKLLGKGSYGNVFQGRFDSFSFAVKLSKIRSKDLTSPYTNYNTSWHEVFLLEIIVKAILEKQICPNLPLLYGRSTCDSCDLILEDKKIITPCIETTVELASGNLKSFLLENKPTTRELHAVLFQIMAALHAIQLYGQIMNFDVKKENILYYNVIPGGFWHYIVHGNSYYIPNYGKLFILNDFGVSRTMSPEYPLYRTKDDKTFRLGSRYAIVHNGKFLPLNTPSQINFAGGDTVSSPKIHWLDGTTSRGAEFLMKRSTGRIISLKTFIPKECKITAKPSSRKFFKMPEVVPPFEFYNDTQDAIRMFISGKRTTQKGNHRLYPSVTKDFKKQLEEFKGKGDSMKDRIFSTDPAQVLAGYFIESFFGKYSDFLEKPKENVIATYTIS